jgi:hypothetical protein
METKGDKGSRVALGGRPPRWIQLRALEVGQRCVLPWLEPRPRRQRALHMAVYNYQRTSGRQFATRVVHSGIEVRRLA